MSRQQRHTTRGTAAGTPPTRRPVERRRDHHPSPLRRVVDGAAAVVVTSGAVAAVCGLVWESGASAAMAWLVVGVAAGHLAVGAWVALTAPSSVQEISRAAAWCSIFVVFQGLLWTSPALYYRLVVVLGALCLISLHGLDAEERAQVGAHGGTPRSPLRAP